MDTQKKSYKLDHDLIFKLASIHCTYAEIAEIAATSVTTLEKRFKNLIEKAIQGDVRMLIWMGKQYLDQKDQPTDEENTAPLPWDEK